MPGAEGGWIGLRAKIPARWDAGRAAVSQRTIGQPARRRAVELAESGDPTALRLCLERILAPRRERAVKFALPPIASAADIAGAPGAVTAAVAEGALTPGEAESVARVVDTLLRAIETSDFDRRLQALENHATGA